MSVKPFFILRQLRRTPKQAAVFVLCVTLSIVTLAAINGFSESVRQTLLRDARQLHAADIIIQSSEKISSGLQKALEEEKARGKIRLSLYYRFYSVVRSPDNRASLLSSLKLVDDNYPFYGKVALRSGKPFHSVLTPGRAIAEQSLLDRLGLHVGDRLNVGYTTLTIADVVLSEPDRPVNFFSLGPRLFINIRDLAALGLLQTGSRIRYVHLVKVLSAADSKRLVNAFKQAAQDGRESVETYETARSGIKRFLDNFLFYLRLVGVFTLIMAGMGIQGALTAFFKEKQPSIAIMKIVGASNKYIAGHFALVVGAMGLGGIGLGIGLGYLVQYALTRLLAPLLPADASIGFSWMGVLEGFALGTAVVLIFSFIPLYRLSEMRPLGIFREEKAPQQRKLPHLILGAMLSIFVAALAIWHMQTLQFGLYVAGGIGVLILVSALLTQLLLTGLKRLHLKRLLLRQAVRGLFRNGNATRSVVITLTASVSVIFCIFLIEENLKATFIDSFPETTPNLFFIDIQPSQKGGFIDEIGKPVRFYPIVRARVTAINGKAVDPAKERQKRQDNFARVFNLTYHEDLLDNEKLIRGERLFRPDWTDIQVSILDVVTDMQPMQVGDTLQFNIQGVPLEARIASIRTRTKDSLSPFFYFVFRPQTLQDAPQTLFTAVNVARDRVGPLQARIAARFPNISAIDLSETLRVFGNMMEKLSAVVRMLSVLSIVAGLLILISAVFATRAERLVESVYFKTLGANQGFVVGLTALENGAIALLSTLLAMSMAQTAAYLICRHILNIHYQGFMGACILATAGLLILVIVIGLSAAWPILVKKPVAYLREQPDG